MKTTLIAIVIAVIFSAQNLSAQSEVERGLAIAKESDAKDSEWGSYSVAVTMTLTNKNGQHATRILRFKSMETPNDGDKTFVTFETPADVKGTNSLTFSHKVKDDDQWLYLPGLGQVKRISSANKSGSFMGSEFAFEDLGSQEIEKYTYRLIEENGEANGVPCFIVERYPVSKSSGYKRQQVYFNKENYRVEKIDYYDRKDVLLKTLTNKQYNLQMNGKYWRPNSTSMKNHITGKETTIEYKEYKFGIGLTDNDFNPANLENAK